MNQPKRHYHLIFILLLIFLGIINSPALYADIPVLPVKDCLFVRSTAAAESQQMAFQSFRKRIYELSGESLITKDPAQLTSSDYSTYHLIVVGRKSENNLINTLAGTSITQILTNDTVAFKKEQGYIIQILPDYYISGRDIVIAGSDGSMGSVYGSSDLQRGLFYSNGSTYLLVPNQSTYSGPTVDQTDSSFTYSANWLVDTQPWYYGGSGHYTITSAANVQISFTGTGINLIYRKNSNYGIANWSIDGGAGGSGQIDMYAAGDTPLSSITLASTLTNTSHTLTISHSGLHNPSATSPYYIVIDAIVRLGASLSTGYFRIEKPEFEYRGQYLNIPKGFEFRENEPHFWDDNQWRDHIDDLIMARMNRLYFYLWYVDLLYPGSSVSSDTVNQNKHHKLREMTDYAHKRGMQVIYMFSPTGIPPDIWSANPSLQAYNPYYPGIPLFNPANESAWPLMRDIYRNEIEWFKNVDAIHVWFYDPGGSFDSVSLASTYYPLARQVKEFYDIASTINPAITVEFNIWPHWAIENGTYSSGFFYVTGLFSKVKSDFNNNVSNIRVMNTVDSGWNVYTYLQNARSLGYPTDGFIFQTNIETGYPFLHPMLDYLKNAIIQVKPYVNGIFCHRIEARAKYPNTFFVGEYLWNTGLTKQQVVTNYANWAVGTSAGPYLAQALLALDSVSSLAGQLDKELELSQLSNQTFSRIPPNLQEKLEWLKADLDCVALLAAGGRTNDSTLYNKLKQEFFNRMKKSKTFYDYAVRTVIPADYYTYFVNFIKNGGNY